MYRNADARARLITWRNDWVRGTLILSGRENETVTWNVYIAAVKYRNERRLIEGEMAVADHNCSRCSVAVEGDSAGRGSHYQQDDRQSCQGKNSNYIIHRPLWCIRFEQFAPIQKRLLLWRDD